MILTIYYVVDIHHCHESSVPGIGDYCNYAQRAVRSSKDGIVYAPKDFIVAELVGGLPGRERKYKHSANEAAETSPIHIDKASEQVEELFEEIEEALKDKKLTPEAKVTLVKRIVGQLRESVNNLESLLKNRIDLQ